MKKKQGVLEHDERALLDACQGSILVGVEEGECGGDDVLELAFQNGKRVEIKAMSTALDGDGILGVYEGVPA